MPKNLREWLIGVLKEEIKPPKQNGKHKISNSARNLNIVMAVYELTQHGYKATSNDGSKPISACDIVAGVVPEFGFNLTANAIKKIWHSSHLAKE